METNNETVEQVLERMTRGMYRDCSVECQLLESDVVEYTDRILAAHNREMEAKDAEIDKLKFDNMRLKSEQRTAAECIIEQTNKV